MTKRPSKASPAPQPLITDSRLQSLYQTLLRARLLRQRDRIAAGAVVREALVTGTVAHLAEGDAVMPVYGDRLSALALGHRVRRILAGSPLAGILPAIPHPEARFAAAAGYALANQSKDRVVLAFSDPAISTLESLSPALAYAARQKLALVFVIETAADADLSSPRHTDALGLYGIPVDGNDVIALYRVAQEAISRARRGLGPTLIDAKPWPLDGAADPARRLEQALSRRGLPYQRIKERTIAAFQKELRAAIQRRK